MLPFKKQNGTPQQAIVLDTCALIDGRILDIAKAGFIPRQAIVPRFVIAELQFLADHGDAHKRERARFGLDVVRDLQAVRQVDVLIAREDFPNSKEVDDKLIALAKKYGAMLYTTDYNLNKVAQIEGIIVLNVNELAQALRPHRLPGEQATIKITQTGQDRTQGVGYLDDGTMVVVERAGNKLGQKVQVEFSRILQTQAGKMMFATLAGQQPAEITQQPQVNKVAPAQPPIKRPIANKLPQQQPPRPQRPDRVQPQPRPNNRQQPRRRGSEALEDRLLGALQQQNNQQN